MRLHRVLKFLHSTPLHLCRSCQLTHLSRRGVGNSKYDSTSSEVNKIYYYTPKWLTDIIKVWLLIGFTCKVNNYKPTACTMDTSSKWQQQYPDSQHLHSSTITTSVHYIPLLEYQQSLLEVERKTDFMHRKARLCVDVLPPMSTGTWPTL